MVKNPITFENRPLKDKLEEDKTREILEVYRESQKVDRYFPTFIKSFIQDTRKVATKVRYLNDNEIRKEKGIMEKPYPHLVMNVLWLIKEKGPINSIQMAKELNVKVKRVYDCMFQIKKRMGFAIVTDRQGKKPHYTLDPDYFEKSVENLYNLYTVHPRLKTDSGETTLEKEEKALKRVMDKMHLNQQGKASGEQEQITRVHVTLEVIGGLTFGFRLGS